MMINDKPYLWLGKDTATPTNFTLEIAVQPSPGFSFNFGPQIPVADPANFRLTYIFTRIPGPGTIQSPTFQFTTPPGNVVYQKITVMLLDGTKTIGTATALLLKAIDITKPHMPKLWFKFIRTGSYELHFDTLVNIQPLQIPIIPYNTITPPPPPSDTVSLLLSPSINIITIHDTSSANAEQGSTSTSDADASGGGDLLADI